MYSTWRSLVHVSPFWRVAITTTSHMKVTKKPNNQISKKRGKRNKQKTGRLVYPIWSVSRSQLFFLRGGTIPSKGKICLSFFTRRSHWCRIRNKCLFHKSLQSNKHPPFYRCKNNKKTQKSKISVQALNQIITTFHSPLARSVNIFLFKWMTKMNIKEVKYRNEIRFN